MLFLVWNDDTNWMCVCSVVPYPLCAVLIFDDVAESTVFSVAPVCASNDAARLFVAMIRLSSKPSVCVCVQVVSGVRRDPNVSVDMFRQLVEQNFNDEVRRRRQIRRMLRSMEGLKVMVLQ